MIKKLTVLLFCFISINNLCGQSKNNIEDIFKMQLFLNKKNTIFRNMDYSVSKNDSLYKKFKEVFNIKIDTLKINNKLSGVLENQYQFFKITENNIVYDKILVGKESRYLLLETMMNCYYVLAVNTNTGASYRLSGFDANDFFGFLSDFKEEYLNSNFIKLKNSTFFKNYKVEYLDFNCLYEGLSRRDLDREKYECLRRCSEPFKINHNSTDF
ncbi:hypothetical protein FNW52_10755 [Flavobacterium sp. ZT3R18]|uniref:hypothetical protein n=1 Tax=Flavobacterium sp. ZT3R18 TaxID=2594429 RepID=UPI00117A2BEE|nr:hypothetical protein [Flavobacterium sp. ZT3R18]TRX35511.1 hypothetical protein FNW52_10755 [Flavobacterium sp. ZT3R18]